jgi:DNA polymerase-3 subunit delta
VCFPSSKEITESDVESILVHNREESAFSLFDSISNPSVSENERLQKGLEILQRIRLSKDNSSVMLIAGLTSCFRKLSIYHKLQSARMNDDFNLKINGFSSKKMKTQYNRASKIWTVGQVVAILSLLSSADMSIRSSGTLLEDTLLQKLLYEIIIKKGGTSAVYDFSLN